MCFICAGHSVLQTECQVNLITGQARFVKTTEQSFTEINAFKKHYPFYVISWPLVFPWVFAFWEKFQKDL